jgi:hypothetical protein
MLDFDPCPLGKWPRLRVVQQVESVEVLDVDSGALLAEFYGPSAALWCRLFVEAVERQSAPQPGGDTLHA